ncbi:Translation initiation factor IF-3 [compost metagenome]
MILNETIKASEVHLTGLKGEDLGIISTIEALALAKKLKVDLVCTSLMSSPPPCKLIGRGAAKQAAGQDNQQARKKEQPLKVKEVRLTAGIEQHDYETKRNQAEKMLKAGNAVQLVVRLNNSKEGVKGKELIEGLLKELAVVGKKHTGIQVSGKQAAVQVNPL